MYTFGIAPMAAMAATQQLASMLKRPKQKIIVQKFAPESIILGMSSKYFWIGLGVISLGATTLIMYKLRRG